jgi:MFS family permease
LILLALFVLQELQAPEPILPPRLFVNPVIRVATIASFLVAMAMFGATVLLPVFLQIAGGASPSHSGVLVIPLMTGTVAGAYTTGRLMRRTGRYKPFPLIGLGCAIIAFALLATVTAATPRALSTLYMAVLGIGFGLVNPVLLVSVQNAAEPRDVGAATSAVAFFRSMGGSFGVAGLWTVLLMSLGGGFAAHEADPSALRAVGGASAGAAVTHAFHVVFLVGAGIAVASLAVAWQLREIPLRTTPAAPGAAEAKRPRLAEAPRRPGTSDALRGDRS